MRKLVAIFLLALVVNFSSCIQVLEIEKAVEAEQLREVEAEIIVFPVGKADPEFSDVVDLSAKATVQSISEILVVPEPTVLPTASPTPTPTVTLIVKPTVAPTSVPKLTPKPTIAPTPTVAPAPIPTATPIPTPEPIETPSGELEVKSGEFNNAVLAAINDTRAEYSNGAMHLDSGLCTKALAHAKEMAKRGELFHSCGGAESVSNSSGNGSTIGTRSAAHATGLALDADRTRLGVGSVRWNGVQYTCVFAPRD